MLQNSTVLNLLQVPFFLHSIKVVFRMGAGSTLRFGTVHPSAIFITIQLRAMELIFFINNPDNTAINIKNNDFSLGEPKEFHIAKKVNLSQANNLNNIDTLFTGPAIGDYRLI